uniref:Fatty acyl-CoA reductase n=2 Tax=Cacopsylla melanoneura TaxID=428564 RepID=A0A8D9FFJ1_9HEMI
MNNVIEGADISIEDFLEENLDRTSDIQCFFRDANVFITGATGFMGKVLLEKLIRSCPEIGMIYILVRPKLGKSQVRRFYEIFEGPFFERMKSECPNYLSKVRLVSGDCLKPNLGLSDEDRSLLCACVDCVFHAAAAVRFDTSLRVAVITNVRATVDLLNMARAMPHLKAFVFVSTAYSNCDNEHIEEKFYEPPIPWLTLTLMAETLSETMLTKITPGILGKWPNAYALTKCVAEDVVRSKGDKLPIAIVRPSIVIATSKEPIAGWINNFYGPTGVVAGAGIGLLRSLHCDGNMLADLVPVDMVINCMIAAAWDVARSRFESTNSEIVAPCSEEEKESPEAEYHIVRSRFSQCKVKRKTISSSIPVYNFVSSNQRALTWQQFMSLNERAEPQIPSQLMIWYYCFHLNKHKSVHLLSILFLHWIPALLVDLGARLIGQKPRMVNAYKKIHRFSEVLSYFSTRQWLFNDKNTSALWRKLNEQDQKYFNFDIGSLVWEDYFYTHMRGLRVYLVKDSLDTVPQGIRKRHRFMLAHYTLIALVVSLLCLCFLNLFSFIWRR